MSHIQLVALDLDGTLFNNQSVISQENLKTIRTITDAGIHVVISTGRPFNGVPFVQLEGTGIDYAITANGSGIYRISTGECLFDDSMPEELILPILDFLLQKDINIDAFIAGKGVSPTKCRETALKLSVPDSIKAYIVDTRFRVDDLADYIHSNHLQVQKMTLNFLREPDGTLKHREEVRAFLEGNPQVTCVCGGYNNLEFTRVDVSKGAGLLKLADALGVAPCDTMAIGDTENDISIIDAAGIGVAMGNATPDVKEAADYITCSNEEDGVAAAIRHFLPELF